MLPTMDGRAEIRCSRGVSPKRSRCRTIVIAHAPGPPQQDPGKSAAGIRRWRAGPRSFWAAQRIAQTAPRIHCLSLQNALGRLHIQNTIFVASSVLSQGGAKRSRSQNTTTWLELSGGREADPSDIISISAVLHNRGIQMRPPARARASPRQIMTTHFTISQFDEAATAIRARTKRQPRIAMILGSGLNGIADAIVGADVVPFQDLPYFPTSTVVGHSGKLLFGELHSKSVLIMQGRVHFYEGYTMAQVTLPVRLMQRLGNRDTDRHKRGWRRKSGFPTWGRDAYHRSSEFPGDDGQQPPDGAQLRRNRPAIPGHEPGL